MRVTPLPPDGAVLVLTDAPGAWGEVVADRNAAGRRTALLIVPDVAEDPLHLAEQMAADVFHGAEWELVDARVGIAGAT